MMSIGYGLKIHLRGAMPYTQTWWLRPPPSSLLRVGVIWIFTDFICLSCVLMGISPSLAIPCVFLQALEEQYHSQLPRSNLSQNPYLKSLLSLLAQVQFPLQIPLKTCCRRSGRQYRHSRPVVPPAGLVPRLCCLVWGASSARAGSTTTCGRYYRSR